MTKLQKVADALLDLLPNDRIQKLKYWGFVQDFAQTLNLTLTEKESERVRCVVMRWDQMVQRRIVKSPAISFDYKVHVLDRLAA